MSESSILRPIPQRVWQITPASSDPPSPASPAGEESTQDAEQKEAEKENTLSPSRTRSILNLTSSTLFGIYSPSGPDGTSTSGFSQANTPWGAGAMTPQTGASSPRVHTYFEDQQLLQQSPTTIGSFERPRPHAPRRSLLRGTVVPLAVRTTLLFICGLLYGVMVTYLHDNETLAPVKLEGVHRHTWQYLCFWGGLSVILGNMLPWLDVFFEEGRAGERKVNGSQPERKKGTSEARRTSVGDQPDMAEGTDWFEAVRGLGVFIGIAFAIVSAPTRILREHVANIVLQRKLPWESTSQAILTLVLVNPFLWYALDRSQRGFIVSTLGAFGGTIIFMALNPKTTRPSQPINYMENLQPRSLTSPEAVAVAAWVASVIFCSCVCFRSVGRRLAFKSPNV